MSSITSISPIAKIEWVREKFDQWVKEREEMRKEKGILFTSLERDRKILDLFAEVFDQPTPKSLDEEARKATEAVRGKIVDSLTEFFTDIEIILKKYGEKPESEKLSITEKIALYNLKHGKAVQILKDGNLFISDVLEFPASTSEETETIYCPKCHEKIKVKIFNEPAPTKEIEVGDRPGIIFRWNRLEILTPEEFEYWKLNPLPMGWSIIQEPSIRKRPKP